MKPTEICFLSVCSFANWRSRLIREPCRVEAPVLGAMVAMRAGLRVKVRMGVKEGRELALPYGLVIDAWNARVGASLDNSLSHGSVDHTHAGRSVGCRTVLA